jgi:hypothetical protein
MADVQAFGTAKDTFYTGTNGHLLKHVCPSNFGGGPFDAVPPDREFRLSLMSRFDLPLPPKVAAMVGTNRLPMWVIDDRGATPRRSFPSPLLRMVQGEVIHARVGAEKNTHTIHWHGIEPTPMNDGVGKHSFEISGNFTYQFQTNEAGTYFYHCHKNTVLHFEMGLYGGLIVDPVAPAGSGLTAPYVTGGPGFAAGHLTTSPPGTELLPYDLEKIWVVDDMDSSWHYPELHHSHNMQDCDSIDPADPDSFYKVGTMHPDLHVFRQNIFAVSGVVMDEGDGPPFVGRIDAPAVRIDAALGQTVLLRYINASYTIQELTLPVDATVIAWDGHPLGVGAFHQFSFPYVVRAGRPIRTTSARRFDVIPDTSAPVSGTADIRYYDWIKGAPEGLVGHVQIPVHIG